ncbi:homocysteine S-methyltransferase family protein [Ruegeria sp. R13_0]|uniref:homocysteine S-methyltransferase family protein n=1 Tax=Ruegeria sp. R13_0 TaxID=2821099 RepID=UPI001AD9788E|nr:homocysteine S-methyltransferase family protein [Ruegeria sp. R13_0]MBO9436870.1 homocysteine S-methyltransferase family protein [Ruegeria sp. R13_0]
MRIQKLKETRRFFLSDGGLETFLIFDKGYDLPCFSAAVLLDTEQGRADLRAYFERFIDIAKASGRGFILDAPTWRAGTAWAGPLGLTLKEVMETNQTAVSFVSMLRAEHETETCPILLNGLVGPAGDAYAPDAEISRQEALLIHAPQIHALGKAGVDMISAMTLTHAGEAIGIVQAAKEIDVPVVIAFTLETDGQLPSGQSLGDAIAEVDAATNGGPIYYMINCAHPDHFRDVLDTAAAWTLRIGGIRSNASRQSHAELDEAEVLDDGDPVELGMLSAELVSRLPNIRVLGGCCGTDHRHVGCIAGHDHPLTAA